LPHCRAEQCPGTGVELRLLSGWVLLLGSVLRLIHVLRVGGMDATSEKAVAAMHVPTAAAGCMLAYD
jgi:hypothetical protein